MSKQNLPAINLDGDQGNVFYLMLTAKKFATQLDYANPQSVVDEMKAGSYLDALEVFQKHFGHFVRFETSNEEILQSLEGIECASM